VERTRRCSVVPTPPCHPEEAESRAKRATPDEEPMQLASISLIDALSNECHSEPRAKLGEEPAYQPQYQPFPC